MKVRQKERKKNTCVRKGWLPLDNRKKNHTIHDRGWHRSGLEMPLGISQPTTGTEYPKVQNFLSCFYLTNLLLTLNHGISL